MSFLKRNSQPLLTGRSAAKAMASLPDRKGLLRRLLRRAAWTAGVLIIAGFVYLKGRDFLYESSYFTIRTVIIEGAGKETTGRIQAHLDSGEGPRNLLEASPGVIRTLLLDIPEIRDVQVRRHLPDTMIIEVQERHPVVILVGENNYLLDSDLVAMGTIGGKEFLDSRLPLMTLDAAPAIELGKRVDDPRVARAWTIVSELRRKSTDIATRVSETHIGEEGDITLHLDHGTEVRLGQRRADQVLPILEAFYEKTDGMKNLEYAELEYRNQVAFKRRGSSDTRTASVGGTARDGNSLPSH